MPYRRRAGHRRSGSPPPRSPLSGLHDRQIPDYVTASDRPAKSDYQARRFSFQRVSAALRRLQTPLKLGRGVLEGAGSRRSPQRTTLSAS